MQRLSVRQSGRFGIPAQRSTAADTGAGRLCELILCPSAYAVFGLDSQPIGVGYAKTDSALLRELARLR